MKGNITSVFEKGRNIIERTALEMVEDDKGGEYERTTKRG